MQANQSFTVTCDYGYASQACIQPTLSPASGGSCAGGVASSTGTSLSFNCAAGATPGTYTVACAAQAWPACQDPVIAGFCTAGTNNLGTLTITPPCTNAMISPPILSTTTVSAGQTFTVACNFGSALAAANNCVQMDDGGASGICSPIVSGNTVTFTCLAAGTPGTYPVKCLLSDYTTCPAGGMCSPAVSPSPSGITISNNPCGTTGLVCGNVTSAELAGVPLPNIVVELRNADGSLTSSTQTTRTDANGYYSFATGNSLGSVFFVNLSVDRTQVAAPLSQKADNSLSGSSVKRDFVVRGIPATLSFIDNPPASLILVTTFTVTSPSTSLPPSLNGFNTESYATTVAADGSASLAVPPGRLFYYTCWTPLASGGYAHGQSQALNGTHSVLPLQQITQLRCP